MMSGNNSVQDEAELDLVKKPAASSDDVVLDFDINEDDLERMQAPVQSQPAQSPDANFDLDLGENDIANDTSKQESGESKSKLNLIIIAAVLVGLLVLGAFGYFAMQVIGGGSQNTSPSSQLGTSDADSGGNDLPPGNEFSQGVGANDFSSSAAEVEALAAQLGVSEAVQVEPVDTAPGGKDILITQGAESLGQAQDQTAAVKINEDSSEAARITEEERLYDNLLSSVEGMDVPPEAIKIDQGVINRKLENQRIASLEQEVKDARSSMTEIKSAVEGMRSQVNGFAQVIEKGSVDQAAINESINKLTEEVKNVATVQEKELRALKAAVDRAQKSADQAAANAGEAKKVAQSQPRVTQAHQPAKEPVTARPAVVATNSREYEQSVAVRQPIAAATAINPVVAPTKVFSETKTPAVVQARTEVQQPSGSGLPAHCDGSRVSANWRVKGVNSHSAYVVRSQDKQGMYLKVGVDVPGYGQVQMFDATNRAVCTTNGLIRR